MIKIPINIVSFVQLSKLDCYDQIKRHKEIAGDKLVGIRMILNYLPSWYNKYCNNIIIFIFTRILLQLYSYNNK